MSSLSQFVDAMPKAARRARLKAVRHAFGIPDYSPKPEKKRIEKTRANVRAIEAARKVAAVLTCRAKGLPLKAIMREVGISKTHVGRILARTSC